MDNKIIDGKIIAEQIKKEIAAEVADMIDHGIKAPHLAAVIVGDDGASKTYVASKETACHSVGMSSSVYRLPVSNTEKEMLDTLKRIAFDNDTSVAEIIRVVMADFLTSYRNDSGSEIGVSNA